jgi:sugar lactone lactonase YvrE
MRKFLFAVLFLTAFSINSFSSEPLVWSVNSRADVLKGDARGVSIDQNGTITLAPKLTEVFKTEQSYIWSSAVDASGNVYLGTGGDGKVFKVDSAGKGALFSDLAEMNVSSLAVGRGGEVFAATSPDGKVYRIDANGKADIYFSPRDKYIWSLAVLADGSLAIGTGDGGKIYKVKAANATPESSLLFDTSEAHIISLATDKQGNLFAGTDSNGIVMRFGADGKPFGLLDSPLREIHELAVGPDGSVYALALGESASAPKTDAAATPAATPENKTVSVDKPNPANPEPAAKSRYDLTGAKTAVYRILPDGGTDILWASTTVTGFSLYAHQTGSGVLLGTSDKGRIYNVSNDGRETLVLQTDANQVSTIHSAGNSLIATSSNQGSLYRFGGDSPSEGTYESAVLDAKATATWGRIWWRSSGPVTIQTRSGNTEKPDETWAGWSAASTSPAGTQVASPKARYLQWRSVLKASSPPAALNEVNLAFVARNIAPEILSLQVLPTSVGLAANPPVQIDPNIELSGLDPASFGIPVVAVPPRKVYQRGVTSLQWTAEDRNGDKIVYDVYYKEVDDAEFKLFRGALTDNFIAIDGQSLADGRYLIKIVARDTPSNPAALALSGERITEPIDIDNTAPVITAVGSPQITGEKARVTFEASDAASYLVLAEYSVNGSDWLPVYADDGISDSPKERYTIEITAKTPGEYAVTIRVFDANRNAGNSRAAVKK